MKKKRKTETILGDDVKRVAALSKLTLRKGEIDKFRKQLASIFKYVNQIGEMKAEGTPETNILGDMNNVFREDVINNTNILSQKEALSCAKKKHNGFFVVKAIFEE